MELFYAICQGNWVRRKGLERKEAWNNRTARGTLARLRCHIEYARTINIYMEYGKKKTATGKLFVNKA